MIDVALAKPGTAAWSFQHERRYSAPVAEIVTLLRRAIEADGLWLIHETDPQALLASAGRSMPAARQIMFFHPALMVRLLAADPTGILEAPIKFALLQEHGCVSLRWIDPVQAYARYGAPAMAELGCEIDKICEGLVGSLEQAGLACADHPSTEKYSLNAPADADALSTREARLDEALKETFPASDPVFGDQFS